MVDPARQFELEPPDQRNRIRLPDNRNVQLGKDSPESERPLIWAQARSRVTQKGTVPIDLLTDVMFGQVVAAHGGQYRSSGQIEDGTIERGVGLVEDLACFPYAVALDVGKRCRIVALEGVRIAEQVKIRNVGWFGIQWIA